jgi:hypothetical protein
VAILPKAALRTVVGNARDEFHLEFFARVTAPKIAGFYDDVDFWRSTVVQLGHREPAVRLAIQAVSALHAEVEKLEGNRVLQIDYAILNDYNTAIRHLVQGSSDPMYVKAVVVALFVCLEFLAGNEDAASIHINGGLKLLHDWREKSASSSPQSSSSADSSPRAITDSESELVDQLSSTFSRLAVHSKVYGKRMFVMKSHAEDPLGENLFHFNTTAQARDVGFVLLSDAINFISKATPKSYTQEGADESFHQEQRETIARILEWRRAWKDFARRSSMSFTQMQIRGGNMLQCLVLCSYIWLSHCLTPYEEDYDKYTAEFQEVIDLAQTIIDIPDEYLCNNVGRFQIDMGLIPSLHLVGGRCRVPSIRKAAMEMLAKHHWREGLFDSFRSAEAIAMISHLEELRKKELMGLHDNELADYMPCEGARIHFMGVDEASDNDGQDFLMHSFYSKPYGAFGDWHVQQCRLRSNPNVAELEEHTVTNIQVVPNSAFIMPNIHSGHAYEHSASFNPEVLAGSAEKRPAFTVPSNFTETLNEQSNGMFYMHLMGAGGLLKSPRQDHDVLII